MFFKQYNKTRVLVTGHTGFKGSWLCAWLKLLGADVTGFSISVPTSPAHFSILGGENFVPTYWGDIRNRESILDVLQKTKPEIVFHIAAQPLVRRSYANPHETFSTNMMGTLNVLDAIHQVDSVRAAVIITSDKCYKNVEWVFSYRENDVLGGDDPYSASKACAELITHSYASSFFKHTNCLVATTRAGNVIGGGDWAEDRIVPDAMRAWSNHQVLSLRSPNATRPWQHVLEPLSGYLLLGSQLLLGEKSFKGESFNFGPDTNLNYKVGDVVKKLSEFWLASQIEYKPDNSSMKECNLLSLSCEKASRLLNWRPTWNFEETLLETGAWYKKYYEEGQEAVSFYTNKQVEKYISNAKEKGLLWSL